MTAGAGRGFVAAAAAWDADSGPPEAGPLSRAERSTAGFSTRILAHVLGRLQARAPVPLSSLPWVLGLAPGPPVPALSLRGSLAPGGARSLVHAEIATVPMALIEALAHLASHHAVLVAFVDDATPPYHEALAAAWLLVDEPAPQTRLVLEPPTLRRTSSHSERTARRQHPLVAGLRLARAIDVGQPTVETVPSCEPGRSECWRIELSDAF